MRFGLRTAIVLALVASSVAAASNRAISPDGKHTATILPNGAGQADGTGSEVLMLGDMASGKERRLLISRYDENRRRNLTNLSNPLFSLNGGYVYVSASDIAPVSNAVHQIDLKTGAIRFVIGGRALKVIRTGPYRGYLLVQQHRYYEKPEGGSYNPVFVIRPDGHEEFMVPGSGNDDGELAVEPWLAKRNWRAW